MGEHPEETHEMRDIHIWAVYSGLCALPVDIILSIPYKSHS